MSLSFFTNRSIQCVTLKSRPWCNRFKLQKKSTFFSPLSIFILNECDQVTQHFIILLKLKPMSCFPVNNTITINSDCSDSPSKLVPFLFLQGTCFQQQKHVCALSSGYPSLKWNRPHIPLPTEKKDLITAAKRSQHCGNVLQGVGEICVKAESACDVFIRPMQIMALPHSNNDWNMQGLCFDAA